MNDEMELTPAQEPAGTEPVRTLKQAPRLPEAEAPIPAPAQEEPEAPALPERLSADLRHSRGDADLKKAPASVKCPVSD